MNIRKEKCAAVWVKGLVGEDTQSPGAEAWKAASGEVSLEWRGDDDGAHPADTDWVLSASTCWVGYGVSANPHKNPQR